jgi:hypothetical protein
MVRVIVCSGAMIGFIIGARYVLNGAFDNWGFGWGTAVCLCAVMAMLATGYLIDRADSRSRAAQPPAPPDYR